MGRYEASGTSGRGGCEGSSSWTAMPLWKKKDEKSKGFDTAEVE